MNPPSGPAPARGAEAPPRPARRRNLVVVLLLVGAIVGAFVALAWIARPPSQPDHLVRRVEADVREVTLADPGMDRSIEYSGATRWGDELLLLPQYPARVAEGALLALSIEDLRTWLRDLGAPPIAVRTVALDDATTVAAIRGFEGYEAVVALDDELWFSIEARRGLTRMEGWLVPGHWNEDRDRITLDDTRRIELPVQSGISNKAYEALTVCDGRIVAIYELASPSFLDGGAHALAVDPATGTIERWPVPPLAFRITDATLPNDDGIFHVLNYAWPGDRAIASDRDPLAERWGIGPSHARSDAVERLVPWRCGDGRIEAVDAPPLFLTLAHRQARNWEAIVALDDGWLIATDFFPRTIVGWVARPDEADGNGDSLSPEGDLP